MKFLIKIWFLIIFLNSNKVKTQQILTETPKNLTVLSGEDAILKCSVKNKKGEFVWCKEESFCTFVKSRNSSISRFSLVGEESKGEYNLLIRNASVLDETKYQCQVTATDSVSSVKSDWAFLKVFVKPELVSIVPNVKNQNQTVRLILNTTNSVECTADNSNPDCTFTWFLNDQELKSGGEITSITVSNKKGTNKLFKSTGKISIKPATFANWNEKILKCSCKNEHINNTNIYYDTKPIIVHYTPTVSVFKRNDDEIINGKLIQFECDVKAEPPVTNYKWSIEDRVFSNGNDERFLNIRIESNMNNKLLKCEAKNEIGAQSASYKIEVSYSPKFLIELPSHMTVKLNEQLHLKCEVDNAKATIVWIFNDSKFITNPILSINSMKPENYGTYKCVGSVKEFPDIWSSVKVVPPGPPVITAEPIQSLDYGQEGNIECIIEKEPKADVIEWLRSDIKIDTAKDNNYLIQTAQVPKVGFKTILTIKQVKETDVTNYTCMASNNMGFSSKLIRVELREKTFSGFSPFILIILSLISLTFLIFVHSYFRLCKNNKKKSTKSTKNKSASKNKLVNSSMDRLYQQQPYLNENSWLNVALDERPNYSYFNNMLIDNPYSELTLNKSKSIYQTNV